MPTRGRVELAAQALSIIKSQTYEPKEIVIVDDDDDPSFRIPPNGVVYIRQKIRYRIGQKRNQCCEAASGEIIAHFDSDDWSAPKRLFIQVELLKQSQKAVTGFHDMVFYEEHSNKAGKYERQPHGFALGTSLVYRRDWWRSHPYREQDITGTDNKFAYKAAEEKQLITISSYGLQIARVHKDQTNQSRRISNYKPITLDEIPPCFFLHLGRLCGIT